MARKLNQTNNWDLRKKVSSRVVMHSERTLFSGIYSKWLDFSFCNYSTMGQGELQPFSSLSSLAGNCRGNPEGRVVLPSLSHTHS